MVHWGDLGDVHAMIFAMAGPLTQFLNQDKSDPLISVAPERVWRDVFEIGWDGNFDKLPSMEPNFMLFKCIHTKEMYNKCKEYFSEVHCTEEYELECTPISEDMDIPPLPYYMVAAMENLWLDELDDWLQDPNGLAYLAIVGGHFKMLQHLSIEYDVDLRTLGYLNSSEGNGYIMDIAAGAGYFDILKLLHDSGNTSCSENAMDDAACSGHLHIVQWLHENRAEGCTTYAMDAAAGSGHLNIVIWLHDNRSEGCTTNAMDNAADNGHFDVVKYLHQHRSEGCTAEAIDSAAANGHLDIVKYLIENRTEGFTSKGKDNALQQGHIEIVELLNVHDDLCSPKRRKV